MSKIIHAIILSTKSAGSSALHNCLLSDFGFNKVEKTQHFENETLYWSKAASILGLPQKSMHRSVVPYSKAKALNSLNEFLLKNDINQIAGNPVTKADLFRAYSALVIRHKPRFIEKSPHHLYNKSNLDLLADFTASANGEIDFKIIGLVRHPLSVIYSGWQRWGYDCRSFEREWTASYVNLLQYRELLNIHIIRYEDLILKNGASLGGLLAVERINKDFYFKDSSLHKWKADRNFAHRLLPETIALARKLGYDDFDTSDRYLSWYWSSKVKGMSGRLKRLIRKFHKKKISLSQNDSHVSV